jgi:hypothetical protein
MPPAGFEPAIPVSEWLQAYTVDREATEIGENYSFMLYVE